MTQQQHGPTPLLWTTIMAVAATATTMIGMHWYAKKCSSTNKYKVRRAKLTCQCGKIEVQIYQPAANYMYCETPHLQCACTDCVGMCEKVLSYGSTSKQFKANFFNPGVSCILLYNSELLVTRGVEFIQSMKLSKTTTNRRLYSRCCGTPLGISTDSAPITMIHASTLSAIPNQDRDLTTEIDFPGVGGCSGDGRDDDVDFLFPPTVCVRADQADPNRPIRPSTIVLRTGAWAPGFIAKTISRMILLAFLGDRGPGFGFPLVGEIQYGLESIQVTNAQ